MKGKSAVREQQRASEWNKLTRWRHTERGITTMDAVNAVQMFILVWTFTAVCQAEDLDISVSCDDVTGSVGKEVTLTCNVSLQSRDCSTEMGMFRYPNDSVICKQKLPKDSSFTCRYTPTTAMTEKFSFFVQTKCGMKQTEFIVDISDGCSISCDDVTATVGKEVNLTCTVSQQCIECCITMFKYSEINTDSEICAQALPEGSCEHRNSFTCRYTPTTAKTAKIKFFVRIKCGWKKTEFTVDVTDPISVKTEDPESKYPIITSVVGCFIIILFITIITIICKTKQNFTKSCGFQKRMFLCIRHDEDNTTPPETVI